MDYNKIKMMQLWDTSYLIKISLKGRLWGEETEDVHTDEREEGLDVWTDEGQWAALRFAALLPVSSRGR